MALNVSYRSLNASISVGHTGELCMCVCVCVWEGGGGGGHVCDCMKEREEEILCVNYM